MELNQNYIVETLTNQGVGSDEIQSRLLKWQMSKSTGGSYDPLVDSYADLSDYEPSEAFKVPQMNRIPLPSETESTNVPKLASYRDVQPVKSGPVGKAADRGKSSKSYLPLNMYGETALKIVEAMSKAFQVNSDLLTATMLMGVAVAANRKATIRHGNYINRPCVWLSVVAVSGYNKSEPMARMLKPLEAINKDLIDYSNRKYNEWKIGGEKGTPPPKRQLILTDSTPESRDELLNDNGLILYRDEIHGLFRDLNRYNQSGEVENFLSIWTGKSYALNRKTQRSYYVENPFLCICGGIQPDMMNDAFGGKGFEGSGFNARWLFLWISDSKVPDQINEELISRSIESEWFTLIQDIWRMPSREYRLNPDAAMRYQSYMKASAEVMNDEDCESNVRAMMAKLRIYALRLALVIHLLRNGANASESIDGLTMDAAVKTCNEFEYWGRKTLNVLSNKEARKTISNSDLLRELVSRYGVSNQSELARLINRSQQYVCRVLNDET